MKKLLLALLIASLLVTAMAFTSCEQNNDTTTTEPVTPPVDEPVEDDPVVDSTKDGHIFTSIDIAPGCAEKGYTEHTCIVCGYVKRDSFVEPTGGHDYVAVDVVAPTCTKEGYTVYACDVCGHEKNDDFVAPGHVWGGWVTVEVANCRTKGLERNYCVNCDVFEEIVVNYTHTWNSGVVVAPTCDNYGYTTYTCTNCGDVEISDYVQELGHVYSDWAVTLAPSCNNEGEEKRECTNAGCDHTQVRALDKVHNYEVSVIDPSCDKFGYEFNVCRDCGHKVLVKYFEPNGHLYVDGWCAVDGHEGVEKRCCSICGHTEYRFKED